MQHVLREDLSGSPEVKTLSWGLVIASCEPPQVLLRESCEVGLPWQGSPKSADRIFDAAFLPGGMGVTEEGSER